MTATTLPNLSRREGGFTLLELLLVIGVAALLLIGGIATYRLVSDGNKTTETTRLLLTIRQEAQTMAQQGNGVYTGVTFAGTGGGADAASPLVTGGVLRDGQRNAFGGTIIIAPATTTVADDSLSVTFNGLSQSACTKLMTSINNPSEVVSVTGNGTTILAAAFPVTPANAGGACNVAGNNNTIAWVFP
ncbi:MAG: hypothetical protein JWM96_344 [Alphaproteobacteria bacterium]|nr:hypothetical protein [Alphaproteobacteria bacterium]